MEPAPNSKTHPIIDTSKECAAAVVAEEEDKTVEHLLTRHQEMEKNPMRRIWLNKLSTTALAATKNLPEAHRHRCPDAVRAGVEASQAHAKRRRQEARQPPKAPAPEAELPVPSRMLPPPVPVQVGGASGSGGS